MHNLNTLEVGLFNPLSANPTKWSNTNNSSAKADEFFEYNHFVGFALKRLKEK